MFRVRHLLCHCLIHGIWMRICQEGLDIIQAVQGRLSRHTLQKKELNNAFRTART